MLARGMEEISRSWERGRLVLLVGVIGTGGGVADWPVIRVEEHSFEATVAGLVVGGSGGWSVGRDGGEVVVLFLA